MSSLYLLVIRWEPDRTPAAPVCVVQSFVEVVADDEPMLLAQADRALLSFFNEMRDSAAGFRRNDEWDVSATLYLRNLQTSEGHMTFAAAYLYKPERRRWERV